MASPQVLSDAEVEKLSAKPPASSGDVLSDDEVNRLSNPVAPSSIGNQLAGQIGLKSGGLDPHAQQPHPQHQHVTAPHYSIKGTDYHVIKNPDGTFSASSPTRGNFRGTEADLQDTLPIAEYLHSREPHYQIHHLGNGKVQLTIPGKGSWMGTPDEVLTGYANPAKAKPAPAPSKYAGWTMGELLKEASKYEEGHTPADLRNAIVTRGNKQPTIHIKDPGDMSGGWRRFAQAAGQDIGQIEEWLGFSPEFASKSGDTLQGFDPRFMIAGEPVFKAGGELIGAAGRKVLSLLGERASQR